MVPRVTRTHDTSVGAEYDNPPPQCAHWGTPFQKGAFFYRNVSVERPLSPLLKGGAERSEAGDC